MLVQNAPAFYGMRFIVGAAEAGFFPGVILYLTGWFPRAERGRRFAWFMTAIAIATAGALCAMSAFWALPTAILSGAGAAAGIAWINSVGNLAGYLSPFLVGKLRDMTHGMFGALSLVAGSLVVAGVLALQTRVGAGSPVGGMDRG